MIGRAFLLIAGLLSIGVPASSVAAAVQISFYSRELGGNNFPHAFVKMEGRPDGGGAEINSSFGFTAKAVTPAVLMGSVGGTVMNEPPGYVAKSDRQFTLVLTDERYRAAMEVITRWREKPQPSYNLNRANCIHFVAEIANAIGLKVQPNKNLMKKPRSFLLALKAANRDVIADGRTPS